MRTILIDGIWSSGRRFGPLRRLLESRCGPTTVFRYDSSGRSGLDGLGAQLAKSIQDRNEPVQAVGFSMGGLILRAAHMFDPTLKILRAVFLNSPHNGSLMAHALPLTAVRQMRPNAPFIRQLAQAKWNIPSLAVWCPLDTMVVPGSSARWEGATRSICCQVPAHGWPVISPRWHRRIVDFFQERL